MASRGQRPRWFPIPPKTVAVLPGKKGAYASHTANT